MGRKRTNFEIRPPAFGGLHHVRLGIGVCVLLRRHRRDGLGGERERKGRSEGRDIRKKKRRGIQQEGWGRRRREREQRQGRQETDRRTGTGKTATILKDWHSSEQKERPQ